MSTENESFASRWSRRKEEVAKEEELSKQPEALEIEVGTVEDDPTEVELSAEEKLAELNALTDEDMPDIESLDENSDFSGFMSSNVSEGLRKMALHVLFHGKAYNIRDGLDEYDGDYTKFAKLDPSTITSDMKHMIGVEAKRALEKEKEEERQRMIAAGEIDEFDGMDEVDDIEDIDDEEDEIAEMATETEAYEFASEEERITSEGFNTTDHTEDIFDKETDRNNEEVA